MPPRFFRTFVLLSFLLSVSCVASEGADRQEPPTPEATAEAETPAAPEATATISLTPRPGTTPVERTEAHHLEAEGDFAGALAAYLGIAAAGGANRADGVYGAARVLLEMERPAEARQVLEPFLASASAAEAAPARYLLARTYSALAMYSEAVEQLNQYIASGRIAAPYAYLDRARILMDAGQPLQAASDAQVGLNAGLPSITRRTFTLLSAQAYEKAGAFAEALRSYQALFDISPGDQPLALSRMAAIKQAQGNPDWANDLARLMGGYPSTQFAMTALKEAEAAGRAVDSYVRGLIYYRHNDYTAAEPNFRARIAATPGAASSAESYYYLGAILESRGDYAGALANYERVTALNPESSLADDALWWRGRLLEDDGKRPDAQALYNQILTSYPNSNWAADAAFRRGLLSYRAGAFREAADFWAGSVGSASAGERQRLQFWQGKALLQAGDRAAAEGVLRQLAAAGEDDYYGIRAVSALKGEHRQPKAEVERNVNLSPRFDWAAAETWLTTRTGRPVVAASAQAWSGDARWLRAQELWLVGRGDQASTEAFDLIEAYAGDAIAMYTMARTLWDQGHFSLSARAGQRLLRVLNTNPNEGLPKALLSLSYPAPFASSIEKHAAAERVSPLLLLAFIRQESFFDPTAHSPANAYGLTQLLPGTANAVASRLGMRAPATTELYKADLNLRLGARYMAEQLREFGGSIFVAFAAYNAGPAAARRWLTGTNNDADVYLESVEFAESRLYIEIVAENYAIYRYLYAGHAVPDLPAD